jgi:mRNA-degrading endonuclease RelE of RelBE toxin-antitoxin system
MNVGKIIDFLSENGMLGELSPEHHVSRRRKKYANIDQAPGSYYRPNPVDELDHIDTNTPRADHLIFIPDGDMETFPELDIEEEQFKDDGTDALAWYVSFHFDPHRWGIYILDKGIYYLSKNVFSKSELTSKSGLPFNMLDLLQQSYKFLFLHEYFHFITDIAASTFEVAASFKSGITKPIYYTEYINKVYMKPASIYEPLEEALANAFAYNKFSGKALKSQLMKFMKNQGSGYSTFDNYPKNKFREGRKKLSTSLCSSQKMGLGYEPLEIPFNSHNNDVSYGDVPVYIVPTIKDPRYAIKFVLSIPRSNIIKSTKFDKDIRKLPSQLVQKFDKTLFSLENELHHKGQNFEKLRGCDTVFSVRIDKCYRMTLRPVGNKWELLRIGAHDDIYRSPA